MAPTAAILFRFFRKKFRKGYCLKGASRVIHDGDNPIWQRGTGEVQRGHVQKIGAFVPRFIGDP